LRALNRVGLKTASCCRPRQHLDQYKFGGAWRLLALGMAGHRAQSKISVTMSCFQCNIAFNWGSSSGANGCSEASPDLNRDRGWSGEGATPRRYCCNCFWTLGSHLNEDSFYETACEHCKSRRASWGGSQTKKEFDEAKWQARKAACSGCQAQ